MGTRSVTIFYTEGGEPLCRFYRQMDGYPEGHGLELAELCDVMVVNGYSPGAKERQANGMGCLAAQVIDGLKDGIGGIYMEPTAEEIGDWVEYVYEVRGGEGERPVIKCSTKTGERPFNLQSENAAVFTGNAKAWLKKYKKKGAA